MLHVGISLVRFFCALVDKALWGAVTPVLGRCCSLWLGVCVASLECAKLYNSYVQVLTIKAWDIVTSKFIDICITINSVPKFSLSTAIMMIAPLVCPASQKELYPCLGQKKICSAVHQ